MAHFLITAGPTREYIDSVRYISNASSGRMGYGLVRAAIAMGHTVHLVTGPLELKPHKEARVTEVVSALEMERVVRAAAREADVLIMAAAVADFRPAFRVDGKIKKSGRHSRTGRTVLEMVVNPDILAGLGKRRRRRGQLVVGFALEADRLIENATAKLQNKKVDLLVANDLDAIGGDKTKLTILDKEGGVAAWPPMTKSAAAKKLVQLCQDRWSAGRE